MKKKFLGLLIVAGLAACAKAPEEIAAVQIDDATYSRSSCKALVKAEIEQTQLLTALSADQKKAQTGDAWGVFLLGLPVSSMSGADKETEIAVSKGKLDAIRRQQASKGCKGAPAEALRPAAPPSEQKSSEANDQNMAE